MLDFRMNTFLSVCKHLNYTRAAEELHITQPAVSQHIHYLEDLYQTELFIHQGKRITLSDSGQLLLQSVIAVKNDDHFLRSLMQQVDVHTIPVNFGVTMTIGEFVIAKPLSRYIEAHPNAKIQMIMGNTDQLLFRLRQGAIQFGIVEGYFSSEEYEHINFLTDDFIAVCSPSYQFHKKEINPKDRNTAITIKDLFPEPLLVREEGSGTRDIFEKNLNARNLSLHQFPHLVEIASINAIVQLVKNKTGISFLYKSAVKSELENHTLMEIPLTDFQFQHDFTFIWENGSIYKDTYLKICKELKSYL